MTSLLITGARGQLGTDLMAVAAEKGYPAVGFGSTELDITDGAAVRAALAEFAEQYPDGVVINAAAHTAVDKAETDIEAAYAVNETGPAHLAAACAAHGLGLISVSTDYVFPGNATEPYQPADATGPQSVYGKSKLAGEKRLLATLPSAHVVRTAWVFGATGANFVKTMVKLEGAHATVSVVNDQVGSPTWSADLAAGLIELAEREGSDDPVAGGVLHATNAGETTWWGFTRAIFQELGADPARVLPTTSDAYPRPAPRPSYSVLSPDAWNNAGLTPLRPWTEALKVAFAENRGAFVPSA